MATNRKAEKTWQVRYEGANMLIDDLTWAEIESVEQATGVPWSMQNPFQSAAVAQAWLALLLVRQGKSDEEAREAVRAMTVRQFKGCFDRVPDDRPTYYSDSGLPVNHPNPVPEGSTTT